MLVTLSLFKGAAANEEAIMIFLYMLLAHVFALHILAFAIYLFPSERRDEMPLAMIRRDLRKSSTR
jgi:hypothetical protein